LNIETGFRTVIRTYSLEEGRLIKKVTFCGIFHENLELQTKLLFHFNYLGHKMGSNKYDNTYMKLRKFGNLCGTWKVPEVDYLNFIM
jgi:hypothetical protein